MTVKRPLALLPVLVLPPLLLALATSCAGGGKQPPPSSPGGGGGRGGGIRHEFTVPCAAGDFRVVVYCADEDAVFRAERAAFNRFAEFQRVFDESNPASEVSQVHANSGLGAIRVSDELYELLRQAERMAVRSDGAVEPSAGAYQALWTTAFAEGRLPTDEEVVGADALVGPTKLKVDPIGRTVHLTRAGMRLDLSPFVRGYGCDLLLAALEDAGFAVALVDGGRRIALGDAPPGTEGWPIRLYNAPPEAPERTLFLRRQGVASSGPLGDFMTVADTGEGKGEDGDGGANVDATANGKVGDGDADAVQDGEQRYARVMDARTAVGAQNLAPATAVARRAWQADGLAQAAAVLGERRGRELARSLRDARVWFHYPPGMTAGQFEDADDGGGESPGEVGDIIRSHIEQRSTDVK